MVASRRPMTEVQMKTFVREANAAVGKILSVVQGLARARKDIERALYGFGLDAELSSVARLLSSGSLLVYEAADLAADSVDGFVEKFLEEIKDYSERKRLDDINRRKEEIREFRERRRHYRACAIREKIEARSVSGVG